MQGPHGFMVSHAGSAGFVSLFMYFLTKSDNNVEMGTDGNIEKVFNVVGK
jgi:hypothetical protein